MLGTRARVRERQYTISKYPANWKRVSTIIRRLADGRCEKCGYADPCLAVHHLGTPYAGGRPGNPRDKHDIRRENLQAICFNCHDIQEHLAYRNYRKKQGKKRHQSKREKHRALGVGTGLVIYQPVHTS